MKVFLIKRIILVTNQAHILELVKKCQLQDKSAQFDLYQKYAKAMYNVAFRIVKDVHYAEDVMQEAFLKAFTQLDRYNEEASFGSWLKRIVMNQSIDFYKKNKRLSFESFDDHLKVIKNSNEDVEHEYDTTNWKVQEVLNQMNTLKESYRIILTLSLIEGYDNEEITEILQINSQQCRTTLSRAKESLRNKMKTNG